MHRLAQQTLLDQVRLNGIQVIRFSGGFVPEILILKKVLYLKIFNELKQFFKNLKF